MKQRKLIAGGLAALAAGLPLAGSAQSAEHFAGKTITVTVPAGSGGTYHVYCLLIATYLGRQNSG